MRWYRVALVLSILKTKPNDIYFNTILRNIEKGKEWRMQWYMI